MEDKRIDLEVLDPEFTRSICVEECGGKCCNFELNDFAVKLSVDDYERLFEHGLHHFVTFVYHSTAPQLVNQLNGNCIFLSNTGKGCTIHPIRPKICRLYPFGAKKVADWCLLYHQTQQKERENLADEFKSELFLDTRGGNMDGEAAELYERYKVEGDSFVRDKIKNYATLDGANEYWIIFRTEMGKIRDARNVISRLKQEHQNTNWKVYSIRKHGSDGELHYQLTGITRNNFQVEVPYIHSFPPEKEDLFRLLDTLEFDPDWREYIVAGIVVPETFRDALAERTYNSS